MFPCGNCARSNCVPISDADSVAACRLRSSTVRSDAPHLSLFSNASAATGASPPAGAAATAPRTPPPGPRWLLLIESKASESVGGEGGVAWTGGCSTLVDGGRAVAGVLAEGPAAAVDEAAALDEEVSWPANFVTSGAWEECEAPVGAPVAAVAVELDGGRPLGSRGGTCGLPHAFVGGVEDVGSGAASNPRFPPFAAFHGEPRPPLLIFFGLRLSLHWRSTSKPVAGGTRPLLPQPVS